MKKIILLAMVAMSINAIAQEFEKQEPNILFAVDEDDDTSTVLVGIRTANPTAPLEVKGEIKADSMHIKGVLHIGDSSLLLGGTTPIIGSDLIQSNNGNIDFGNTSPLIFPTFV